MTTAIIATAILALLVFLLGFNVSRMRGVTASSPISCADPARIRRVTPAQSRTASSSI